MRTIGFRASPKTVVFSVYDSDLATVITVDELKVPLAMPLPEQLKYIRFSILDIMREFEVSSAGIRETEATAQSSNPTRLQIEAVIQEAFASSDLNYYRIGQIASISKWLGIARDQFKPYADGQVTWEEVENWGQLKLEQREAVLVAIGVARDSANK